MTSSLKVVDERRLGDTGGDAEVLLTLNRYAFEYCGCGKIAIIYSSKFRIFAVDVTRRRPHGSWSLVH